MINASACSPHSLRHRELPRCAAQSGDGVGWAWVALPPSASAVIRPQRGPLRAGCLKVGGTGYLRIAPFTVGATVPKSDLVILGCRVWLSLGDAVFVESAAGARAQWAPTPSYGPSATTEPQGRQCRVNCTAPQPPAVLGRWGPPLRGEGPTIQTVDRRRVAAAVPRGRFDSAHKRHVLIGTRLQTASHHGSLAVALEGRSDRQAASVDLIMMYVAERHEIFD